MQGGSVRINIPILPIGIFDLQAKVGSPSFGAKLPASTLACFGIVLHNVQVCCVMSRWIAQYQRKCLAQCAGVLARSQHVETRSKAYHNAHTFCASEVLIFTRRRKKRTKLKRPPPYGRGLMRDHWYWHFVRSEQSLRLLSENVNFANIDRHI